ncbi:MAG TPA: hypothetical protein VN426_04020 [Syntrophomonadaceae bacterium]|nr:hypothetical protein [Syntrophomonadaceae bacterium]
MNFKSLEEISNYHGIVLNDGPGCVIIEEDGTRRPASIEDVKLVFGIPRVEEMNFAEDELAASINWEEQTNGAGWDRQPKPQLTVSVLKMLFEFHQGVA